MVIAPVLSFTPFDPREETESAQPEDEYFASASFTPFDPREDTESYLGGVVLVDGLHRFTPFDPREDTESTRPPGAGG